MSARNQVLVAIRALIAKALPLAQVGGFDLVTDKPARIPSGGAVFGGPGDPGPPEYEFSPLSYTYNHHIPAEIVPAAGDPDALDTMLAAIGAAVLADRTLGGLVNWLDVSAPSFLDDDPDGAPVLRSAEIEFLAEYTVSNPLSA